MAPTMRRKPVRRVVSTAKSKRYAVRHVPRLPCVDPHSAHVAEALRGFENADAGGGGDADAGHVAGSKSRAWVHAAILNLGCNPPRFASNRIRKYPSELTMTTVATRPSATYFRNREV
jgi:hypothetical protein